MQKEKAQAVEAEEAEEWRSTSSTEYRSQVTWRTQLVSEMRAFEDVREAQHVAPLLAARPAAAALAGCREGDGADVVLVVPSPVQSRPSRVSFPFLFPCMRVRNSYYLYFVFVIS